MCTCKYRARCRAFRRFNRYWVNAYRPYAEDAVQSYANLARAALIGPLQRIEANVKP